MRTYSMNTEIEFWQQCRSIHIELKLIEYRKIFEFRIVWLRFLSMNKRKKPTNTIVVEIENRNFIYYPSIFVHCTSVNDTMSKMINNRMPHDTRTTSDWERSLIIIDDKIGVSNESIIVFPQYGKFWHMPLWLWSHSLFYCYPQKHLIVISSNSKQICNIKSAANILVTSNHRLYCHTFSSVQLATASKSRIFSLNWK